MANTQKSLPTGSPPSSCCGHSDCRSTGKQRPYRTGTPREGAPLDSAQATADGCIPVDNRSSANNTERNASALAEIRDRYRSHVRNFLTSPLSSVPLVCH